MHLRVRSSRKADFLLFSKMFYFFLYLNRFTARLLYFKDKGEINVLKENKLNICQSLKHPGHFSLII